MKKILIVIGTRPEAIKMAPLIKMMEKEAEIDLYVCTTGQHSEMLNQVLEFFSITPDYSLRVMDGSPKLTTVYGRILQQIEGILEDVSPDMVLVHGDTATTAAVSMASFLFRIPLGHVEAGLRTGDIYKPWPEEFNRRAVGMISNMHFAPTQTAKANLIKEGTKPENVFVTGNTVIDALHSALHLLDNDASFQKQFHEKYPFMLNDKKTILVTTHRRENFGDGVQNICLALKRLVNTHDDVQVAFPVHLNPNIKAPVIEALGDNPNIHLLTPLDYKDFVYMMKKSRFIISDSGGIQEEAPSLGKPVLVTRDVTERPEAVEAKTVRLVGTDLSQIVFWANELLTNQELYAASMRVSNPYGDGHACERIVAHILGRPAKPLFEIKYGTEELQRPAVPSPKSLVINV